MTINVLIVDDEPNQLELLAFNLKGEGYVVHQAEDGQEAINLATTIYPDIIILDWMMPELSGIDVCRYLRKKEETRDIPVIMLSARGEEGDRTLGLDVGADDYITKPFSPKELLLRVRAVLRRARPSLMRELLVIGDIEINIAQRQLKRGGVSVDLAAKEFKILCLLAERPGQIFNRDQLLNRVWGHGADVSDRTVDAYLSRLRKALNVLEGDDIIKTVRGIGYAFNLKQDND